MQHHEYPKWIYPDGDAEKGLLVHSAEQEAALSLRVSADSHDEQDAAAGEQQGASKAATTPARTVKAKGKGKAPAAAGEQQGA